jgi:hypothetical protein
MGQAEVAAEPLCTGGNAFSLWRNGKLEASVCISKMTSRHQALCYRTIFPIGRRH